ncbi:MAG: hypothetical protein KUG77_18235 [Nannocystaceae bacterium]|nr:hypothetical protein [Nannocystaceae bacterium]
MGLTELDKGTQKDVWERAERFTETPTNKNAAAIFAAKGLKAEEVFWDAKSGWGAYKTAIAILAATDAVMEYADDPSVDKSINTWIAALEAVKTVSDLDAALAESQTFVRAATTHASSLHSKMGAGVGFLPIKFIDGILALLQYEAVARATGAVLKSKTSSENEKDHAREKQGLAYIGMFVSMAGVIVGSPMTYAGMLLYLGGEALLDRDLWADCLGSIEGLPGPGRAVKLVWMEMVNGAEGKASLVKLVEGTPWENSIEDHATTLKSVTSDASEVGTGSFWPIDAPNSFARLIIAPMLRRQYGVTLDFARELVNEKSGL